MTAAVTAPADLVAASRVAWPAPAPAPAVVLRVAGYRPAATVAAPAQPAALEELPPLCAGPTVTGYAAQARDVTGTTGPDVHVVPLGDRRFHDVPGGYPEETPAEVAVSGLPWLTIGADPDGHVRACSCFPSVRRRARGGGEHVRVLVHHAFDQRPSGQQP